MHLTGMAGSAGIDRDPGKGVPEAKGICDDKREPEARVAKIRGKTIEQVSPASLHYAPSTKMRIEKSATSNPASEDSVYFFKGDCQRQQVLAACRRQNHGDVVVLRSPDDLNRNDLQQTVTCNGDSGYELSKGRLFSGEPLTLVLDLTQMSPGQIASMNDLLSTRPAINGDFLSPLVRRIVLVNPGMLKAGPGSPGKDCWRRLLAFPNLLSVEEPKKGLKTFKATSTPLSDRELLQEKVVAAGESSAQEAAIREGAKGQEARTAPVYVDFSTGSSWRTLLFGGLVFGSNGQTCFQPGVLSGGRNSDSIVLLDAPWRDPDFVATLATALRLGGFRANGSWVDLSPSLKLLRKDTSSEELSTLKEKILVPTGDISMQAWPESQFSCLNSHSQEGVLSNIEVIDGAYCSVDTLAIFVSGCETLYITDCLSDAQWLQLLRRLESLPSPPAVVDLSNADTNLYPVLMSSPAADIHCQLYSHEFSALAELSKTHQPYRITTETQWHNLWQSHELISQKALRFDCHESPLLSDLRNGIPVVFHGLHACPALLSRLESLLANPPYLFIHGQKVELPRANISFLFPQEGRASLPPIWRYALQQARPAARPDQDTVPLITMLSNLPPAQNKGYPETPPWTSIDFKTLFLKQVELERLEDGSAIELPIHRRRALHTLLVKTYRGDDEAYGYLKFQVKSQYPDDPPETRADGHALRQWLALHPHVDYQLLKQHFWFLARHCPVGYFGQTLPSQFDEPESPALDLLASYLVRAAAKERREALARSFNVNLDEVVELVCFDGQVRSRLRDALLVAGSLRQKPDAISLQVTALGDRIEAIKEAMAPPQAVTCVKEILQEYFDESLLSGDFKDLAEALVMGDGDSRVRQKRRIHRLVSRVEQHPLVFLQGEAGAGKSYMAQIVASQLKSRDGEPAPSAQTICLGPETTPESLFGQSILKNNGAGDKFSKFHPGPILRWAENDNPPVLILDEANLAREGVLAPLAGLLENPPKLNYQGKTWVLSSRHRVILTGNPDHYAGRHMDTSLQKVMLTLYYRPLPPASLAEFIIHPAWPADWPEALKVHGTKAMLSLYQHYGTLLPDALSPRDLQDILARIHRVIHYHSHEGIVTEKGEELIEVDLAAPTENQLNQLVLEAFSDSLGGRIAPEKLPREMALKQWYHLHFPGDSDFSEPQKTDFYGFLTHLRRVNPDVDLCSAPVVDLVIKYWQFLNLRKGVVKGRRSVMVQGPSGWGKDFILGRVLQLWEQLNPVQHPFIHINANPGNWDKLVEIVKTAMTRGQRLAISELNLLPSRYLEGLFNDVLTSNDVHPDFLLFATINPSSFGGREKLSAAFKSRCTMIQLESLDREDIKNILKRRFNNAYLARWLSDRTQVLSEQLAQSHVQIQLCLDDIFRAAEALKNVPEHQWEACFDSTFGLALQWVNQSATTLVEPVTESLEVTDDGRSERQRSLFETLNRGRTTPLTVKLQNPDAKVSLDSGSQILSLPDNQDEAKLLEVAQYVLSGGQQAIDGEIVGGLITNSVDHKPYKYFAGKQYSVVDYRLSLHQLVVRDNTLQEEVIPAGEERFDLVDFERCPCYETNLLPGQQLGTFETSLSAKEWTVIPGISSRDRLINLDTEPYCFIEAARDCNTGQLLVRLTERMLGIGFHGKVTFTIEPEPESLRSLQKGEHIQVLDGLCDPLIKQTFDNNIFQWKMRAHPAFYELQAIKNIKDMASRLINLSEWCRSFEANRDIPGAGLALMLNLMRAKQGTCHHRSQVFVLLCQYFGVPARIVKNTPHCFVEISPDAGESWRKIQLGGGGGNNTINEIVPYYKYNIYLAPDVPVDQSNYEQNLLKLLEEARRTGSNERLVNFLVEMLPTDHNIFQQLSQTRQYDAVFFSLPWNKIFTSWYCLAENLDDDRTNQIQRQGICNSWLYFILEARESKWQKQEMPESLFSSSSRPFLVLMKNKTVPVDIMTDFLESLSKDEAYGNYAKAVLTQYYKDLTVPESWPEELPKLLLNVPDKGSDCLLDGYSRRLMQLLQQTSITHQWSHLTTEKQPSLERMVLGQPCFPESRENMHYRPVFVCMPLDSFCFNKVFATFWHEVGRKKSGSEFTVEQKDSAIKAFSMWLSQVEQETQNTWRVLLNASEFSNPAESDKDYSLPAGCYPSLKNRCFYSVNRQETEFNFIAEPGGAAPERIKKEFNEPDALVLNSQVLADCFREFLETMDLQKLLALPEK
ncbi:MAG: AAA family ATPase [Endozoicomonas sp.]